MGPRLPGPRLAAATGGDTDIPRPRLCHHPGLKVDVLPPGRRTWPLRELSPAPADTEGGEAQGDPASCQRLGTPPSTCFSKEERWRLQGAHNLFSKPGVSQAGRHASTQGAEAGRSARSRSAWLHGKIWSPKNHKSPLLVGVQPVGCGGGHRGAPGTGQAPVQPPRPPPHPSPRAPPPRWLNPFQPDAPLPQAALRAWSVLHRWVLGVSLGFQCELGWPIPGWPQLLILRLAA